jgi:hypothetical protein
MREAMCAARRKRKQPLLDTKILTSWNALMIRGMAVAGGVLREPKYVQAAAAAAQWLLANHRLGDGTLIRTSRPDAAAEAAGAAPRLEGFLDDYAFLSQALLALHETTGEPPWRDEAVRIVATMKDKFLDKEYGGFYFTAADATDLIVRQKTGQDSPLPSGNAVAAMALLGLEEVEEARRTLAVWAQSIEDHAEAMSAMVQGALRYLENNEPFVVSAGEERAERVASPDQVAGGVVDLSASWASPTELRVSVRIAEGYHLNANRAAQGLVPTTLTVAGLREPDVRIEYPPGEERAFAFTTEAIRVYEGEVVIVARFGRAPEKAARLRAAVTYQPCTEDACLSAVTKQIEVSAA